MDQIIVDKKIDSIIRCVERVQSRIPETENLFLNDLDAQDVLVLNITRAVQLSVDVAMHLCVTSDKAIPETMASSFDCVYHLGIIDKELVIKMKKSVGYRNIAVHNYDDIDLFLTYLIAKNYMSDFISYIKQVNKYIENDNNLIR